MIGMSLIRLTYLKENNDKISWFPILTTIVIMWVIAPIGTIGFSAFLYSVIGKILNIQRSRVYYLIVMPFICGSIFVVYASFFFSTKYFEDLEFRNKL